MTVVPVACPRLVPLIEGDDDPNFQAVFDWIRFKKLANDLETRKLTGNMARDTLRSAADVADIKEWNGFYRRVLLKDLKCGITESTINKVLKATKDAAAEKYIIPVFSCQLAKNGEDHPKKLKGMKTDPSRQRRTDAGNPDVCPVFDLHKIYSSGETREWAANGCRSAGIEIGRAHV